jgi:mono/diheme cytochrome c family protein
MGGWLRALAITAIIGSMGLALTTCRPAARSARPAAAAATTDPAARGAVLYAAYCAGCHGARGHGDGPVVGILDLTPADLRAPGVLGRASDDEIVDRLLQGTPLRSSPRRNAVAEELETEAIAAYLATLSTSNWDLLRAGRFVFEGACAPCHGAYGYGEGVIGATNDPPPADLHTARERYTDSALESIAVNGVGAMPAMADTFDPGELRAVIAYVRHLSKGYRLYDTYCAACHGDDGRGVHPEDLLPPAMPAPRLDADTVARLGPKATRSKILHMLRRESGRMPHFRDTLSEGQLRDVVAYLRHSGS